MALTLKNHHDNMRVMKRITLQKHVIILAVKNSDLFMQSIFADVFNVRNAHYRLQFGARIIR